jgi:SAM-dependent methyltransferase
MSQVGPKRQFAAVQRYGRCRWNTGRSVDVADSAAPDPHETLVPILRCSAARAACGYPDLCRSVMLRSGKLDGLSVVSFTSVNWAVAGADMAADAKSVVARGYDVAAANYLKRFGHSRVRDRWLHEFIAGLTKHARILDLGCGAGVPVARQLAERGFDVVGVDGSIRQIELARSNVTAAEFIHADMTNADFASSSFDGVAAFYSITHVPREEHGTLLLRIINWLKPGGPFVASLGSRESPGWMGEWLGVEMFFSHYDASANEQLVRDAGFNIEHLETVEQDNDDGRFLWVIARRSVDSA